MICLNEHGNEASLRSALKSYNRRNESSMKRLVASIEAAGGMSRSEKDLVDRKAFREARSFLGQGGALERTCIDLAQRFNSGEFDLN